MSHDHPAYYTRGLNYRYQMKWPQTIKRQNRILFVFLCCLRSLLFYHYCVLCRYWIKCRNGKEYDDSVKDAMNSSWYLTIAVQLRQNPINTCLSIRYLVFCISPGTTHALKTLRCLSCPTLLYISLLYMKILISILCNTVLIQKAQTILYINTYSTNVV